MHTNNKLREALGKLQAELWNNTVIAGKRKIELYEIADAALAEPVKNCEVGTAEEQSERFDKFCHANINTQRCCGDCPAFRTTRDDCELVWAQLPYEAKEGGAK